MRDPKDIKIGEFTLKEILERHKHWLNKDCEGWEDMRANLSNANLRGVDLVGADLCCVDLVGACLCCADLCKANLRGANLSGADLVGAYLCCADLCNANLSYADLRGVDLHGAELCCADLYNANLFNANLHGAKLHGAELCYANLRCDNLHNANGNLIEFRQGKILTENLIGYKKCKYDVIVTLEIPRGAIVFSINGDQCRTNKAKVIDIEGACRAYSNYKYMSYYIGDEFNIYDFNCQYNNECSEGIHFYMTREEAIKYNY